MNITQGNLHKLCDYITSKYGIVITKEQEDSLKKYVIERMTYLKYNYFDDYFQWLLHRAGETEWEQFVSMVTINETYFFREPNHFRLLDTQIFQEILNQAGTTRKVRIWSCGCSSGEEPYSIAMAIQDRFGKDYLTERFEILASDLDQSILKKAKDGIYGKNSFRLKEYEFSKGHFSVVEGSRWQIKDEIRNKVKFFRYNVCEEMDNIPELATGVDIVFFRNVSIYFNSETLRKVHERIQARLNLNGYLFVASCETMLHDMGKLKLQDAGGAFFFKKRIGQDPVVKTRTVIASPIHANLTPEKKGAETYDSLLTKIRGLVTNRHGEPEAINQEPIKPLEQKIQIPIPDTDTTQLAIERLHEDLFEESIALIDQKKNPSLNDLSIKAYAEISLGFNQQANATISQMKKQNEFSPVVYLLEGLLYKFSGDLDKSIESLRRSIYLDLNFSIPHFHLGNIYQTKNQKELAKKEFELALKKIEKRKDQLIVFNKPDVSPDYIQYIAKKLLQTF